ncbi:MAG: ribonucleotide reductase N-terminal alpha domain-containing protein, partial [Nanoarchaeota archaeon]
MNAIKSDEVKLADSGRHRAELNINSLNVLRARYLKKDDRGDIIEAPSDMFLRVAKAVAKPESRYGGDVHKAEREFYDMMSNLDFLPNSPTLMNAGTQKQMLSACFVLPIEDSLEQIFDSVKNTAVIEQVGGGVGFSFSRLRPKGDMVGSTKGAASGPVSFMHIFDTTTEVIKQGSRRRGAMMGILDVSHPDIVEFITSKAEQGK